MDLNESFSMRQLQKVAWHHAEDKGFHALPEAGFYKLAVLITSEVGELISAYQKGIELSTHGLPALEEEMADIIIRVADMAGIMNIDLDTAIRNKVAFNATRPHLHGGER